jgi:hypothetical protein
MSKVPFIEFELSNDVPKHLYWIVIKVGGIPCGYIAKNIDIDENYFLVVLEFYHPDAWKGAKRGKFIAQEYYNTVEECKSAFLNIPIGKLLQVGECNES